MEENQLTPPSDPAKENSSPQEVEEHLERYLLDIETLTMWLKEALLKGETQVAAIKTFDARIAGLGAGLEEIGVDAIQGELENIKTHIIALEELKTRVQGDIEKVRRISVALSEDISKLIPPGV